MRTARPPLTAIVAGLLLGFLPLAGSGHAGAAWEAPANVHGVHVFGEHVFGEHVFGEHVFGEHVFGVPVFGVPAPAASVSGRVPSAQNWPQQRYGATQTGYDPNETELNRRNVKNLVTRATAKLDRPFSAAPPVIAGGLVLVTSYYSTGGQPGEIEAFAESCRSAPGESCQPVWKALVGYDDSMGVTVADGKVIANTLTINGSQEIWVFSLHCGSVGSSCSPLWTTKLGGVSYEDAAPTVAGGMIYVPFGQVFDSYLDAFPLPCSTGCRPVWRGKMGDDADASAAVGNGFVYEADYDGDVYAFRIACTTAGHVCHPSW